MFAIDEVDSGFSFSTLASTSTNYHDLEAGDTATIEAEGTTLRLGTNDGGAGDTQRVTTTDNTITSGDPGGTIFVANTSNAQFTA